MKDLKDKVAVVTGAGSGIGRGIAEHAANVGMRLVLADINEKGLNETLSLVKACGVEAITRVTDVSSLDEVENLASQTYETFQNCHLLFNNAGIGGGGSFLEGDQQEWEKTFAICWYNLVDL